MMRKLDDDDLENIESQEIKLRCVGRRIECSGAPGGALEEGAFFSSKIQRHSKIFSAIFPCLLHLFYIVNRRFYVTSDSLNVRP